MSFNVVTTEVFSRQVKRMEKKYPSLPGELTELEQKLSENSRLGTFLGSNTYKIRIAIKSKGKGKRGGGRVITYVVDRLSSVYLVLIYDKSEVASIENSTIRHYTKQIDEAITYKY